MARVKRYIDVDVLTAARQRMRHIFDLFDSVVVMFSGGKDSLVCLELAREVCEERGIDKLDVVFRDEELIPDSVLETVEYYRLQPWCRMIYFAVPLHSKKYVLGMNSPYIQWDPNREWIRQPPAHAYRLAPGDDRIMDQSSMDGFTATFFRGSCGFVTGIRASESLMRFRGCVNKLSENYITKPTVPIDGKPAGANIRLAKPIYDWTETDVFKFIGEAGLKYPSSYEAQLYAGQELRVSTPLHAEASKQFHHVRVTQPVLYEQIIALWPEMLAHERYYRDLDRTWIYEKYGVDFDSIRRFIVELMDPQEHHKALMVFDDVRKRALRCPEAYPIRYVLENFYIGKYKRKILPFAPA